jgi:hypothetical protein
MRNYEECRCFVEHLIAEHRRLHKMLCQARDAITASGGLEWQTRRAEVVRVLRQVRDELDRHFTQEESGGCLDEAVSYCPSLSTEARRIEAEHPLLLSKVDRLIAQALDGDSSVEKYVALGHGFDELCLELESHEAAENVLLRRGFGSNGNGGDE